MSDNVINLFGGDSLEGEILDRDPTAEDVFEKVKDHGFSHVLVIGVDEEGTIGFSTNLGSAAKTLLLVEQFKLGLLQATTG